MGYHSFDLQTIIYSTLSASSALDSLIGDNKIFDNIPQDTSYPYVVIGNDSSVNTGTKTLDGNEYSVDIEVWSQYRGKKEIKDAMEIIYGLFHNVNYAVSGANMVVSQVRNVQSLIESDGITRHGMISLSVIVYDN
tara:strand:+ start:1310 stop:1717 length:408 start_codon:yes stop_codon:yes gene_type:complete